MDRINRDKQLEKFKNKTSQIPVKDYTSSFKPPTTSKGDGVDYGKKKERYKDSRVNKIKYYTNSTYHISFITILVSSSIRFTKKRPLVLLLEGMLPYLPIECSFLYH